MSSNLLYEEADEDTLQTPILGITNPRIIAQPMGVSDVGTKEGGSKSALRRISKIVWSDGDTQQGISSLGLPRGFNVRYFQSPHDRGTLINGVESLSFSGNAGIEVRVSPEGLNNGRVEGSGDFFVSTPFNMMRPHLNLIKRLVNNDAKFNEFCTLDPAAAIRTPHSLSHLIDSSAHRALFEETRIRLRNLLERGLFNLEFFTQDNWDYLNNRVGTIELPVIFKTTDLEFDKYSITRDVVLSHEVPGVNNWKLNLSTSQGTREVAYQRVEISALTRAVRLYKGRNVKYVLGDVTDGLMEGVSSISGKVPSFITGDKMQAYPYVEAASHPNFYADEIDPVSYGIAMVQSIIVPPVLHNESRLSPQALQRLRKPPHAITFQLMNEHPALVRSGERTYHTYDEVADTITIGPTY